MIPPYGEIEDLRAEIAGWELGKVNSEIEAWLVAKAPVPGTAPGWEESGEGGPGMGSRTPCEWLTRLGALHLLTGFFLYSAVAELEVPDSAKVLNDIRLRLRELLVDGSLGSPGVCGAIVKTQGLACRAAATATGVCGRHGLQEVFTSVLAAVSSFPDFPLQSTVFAKGVDPGGAAALCSVCVRVRLMDEVAMECGEMGAPEKGEHFSVFSHSPSWIGSAGPKKLDRPGAQFCLVCASEFPTACQLLGWVMADADNYDYRPEAVLEAGSLWVWSPSSLVVSPDRFSLCRDFAVDNGIAVPPFWAAARIASTPGMAAASALKTGVAKAKAGTNTALRGMLESEVDEGRRIVETLKFGEPVESVVGFEDLRDVLNDPKSTSKAVERVLDGLMEAKLRRRVERDAARESAGASGSAALDVSGLQRQLQEMEIKLDALTKSSTASISGMGMRLPARPAGVPLPTESDRDGFEASHRGHALSLYRARSEDYLGALMTPKAYGKRREYYVGRERIDFSSRRALMPEESAPAMDHVFMIGDTRVEGAAKRMGIPTRGDYEGLAQARIVKGRV